MFRLTDIDHVVLATCNPEAMIAFYCDMIGCELGSQRPDGSLVHIKAGRSIIDLMVDREKPAPAGPPNMHHFCLNAADFDPADAAEALRSRGVAVEAVTRRKSLFLRDPDGNLVELKAAPGVDAGGASIAVSA